MTLRNILAAACLLLLPCGLALTTLKKDNVYRQSALLTGEN
jgi:hypothetical protein